MKNSILALITTLFALSPATAFAASTPDLQNLNLPQLDSVFKVFGAEMVYRPLEPASTHVDLLGFSVGLVAGATSTKKVKNEISGVNINYIPAADLYLGVHGPWGLALELGLLPRIKVKGIDLQQYAGDVKWTINKVFFEWLPVDVAVRGMFSTAQIKYAETINGVNDTIDYDTTLFGGNLAVSKQFFFLEPYAGIGYVRQDATLGNTGTIRLFNTDVTAANSLDKKNGSVWFYGGIQFHIFAANLTAEYDNAFGVPTYSAKVGVKF